ncbi:MAG: FG-GAP-like repeat-containing protein, partial [Candidatus Eisenbacteria bacterium]
RNAVSFVGDILTPGGTTGYFGNAIGGSGDTDGDGFSEILVGTEDWSIAPNWFEGRVFSYVAPRSLPRVAPNWPLAGAQPGTGFGTSLTFLTRPGGGTYPVFFIGDPGYDGTGRLTFHRGGIFSGIGTNMGGAPFVASGSFQSLGKQVADVGDVNRDGYSDFLASSTTADAPPFFQVGRVDFRPGSISELQAPVSVLAGAHDFDRVGSALAGRGDVNGDGFHDFVVGAREWNSSSLEDCGRAWLFLGSPTGPVLAAWSREGSFAGQGLGASMAITDLDGDGYSDVVVGSSAPEAVVTPAPGRVEVFYGGPSGLALDPGLVLAPLVPESSYGRAVAAIGDVNGDAVADLGVGAPGLDGKGAVFVYEGTLGRSQSNLPLHVYRGVEAGARFGAALAGGGDLDGDGIGDLAIGSPGFDGGIVDQGRVDAYYGAPLVPSPTPAFSFSPGFTGARLGEAIAPMNDSNHDGFADVAVGAPGAAGRVYPFFGGQGPGSLAMVTLFEPNVSFKQRLHPARLDVPDQVDTDLRYASPAGRARIGVQFEAVTQNTPFTGVPTQATGLIYDSGAPDQGEGLLSSAIRVFPQMNLPWPGRGYHVRARFVTRSPFFPRSRWMTPEAHTSGDLDVWTAGAVVGVPPPTGAAGPGLRGVAPNPARGTSLSVVSLALPRPAHAVLDVVDVRGARVRRLVDGELPAGPSSRSWDGRDDDGRRVAAGLYFIVLAADGREDRARLVRLR